MNDRLNEGRQFLVALQFLRAVAAILVVWDHIIFTVDYKLFADENLDFAGYVGHLGVCIFFSISGLVMTINHWNYFGKTYGSISFIIKRLWRILPLYWFVTILYSFRNIASGQYPSFYRLISSVLLIPHAGGTVYGQPIVPLGWTLQFEMVFYVIFSISLLLDRWRGLIFLYLTIIGLFLLGLSNLTGAPDGNPVAYFCQSIILYFLLGVTSGILRNRISARLSPHVAGVIASTVLVAACVMVYLLGVDTTPIATGLIILVCALSHSPDRTNWGAKLAAKVGDSAYSIYLTHGLILYPLGKLAAVLVPKIPTVAFVASTLTSAVLFGIFFYTYVEHPIIRRAPTLAASRLVKRHASTTTRP